MKASDVFVKALENEGVEYIFGIPGEENLDFLDSLKNSSIKLVLTRHEQGAGFMAATYGRLTGKVGVCLSTLGPGATNLVTPAAYATLGGMPMMILTGQKPIKKSKQGRFQILNIVDMMKPLTKYSKQVVNANNIASMVRDSFKIAKQEKPGAVHIELPEDIASEEVEMNLFDVSECFYPVSDPRVIQKASRMIEAAKSPLLLIAAGANRSRISEALEAFINTTDIPFFTTQMGKGVIDETHPYYLGTAALSKDDYLHCAIERADLIINVGHDVTEKPPFIMEKGGQKVIHVNFSSSAVDETYFPQLDVIGDISDNIRQLSDTVTPQDHWDFDYFLRTKAETEEHLEKYLDDERFPILPQKVVKEVRDVLGKEDIVTLDNGIYKIWFARNYKCFAPNTLLLDNALATMGAGLASAIAAKMIHPDKKVISISGDGGFMMNAQELETATRMDLDFVIIILNDAGYGMIKWKQDGMAMENYGLDFSNPDFVLHAESYGVHGYRPDSVDEFVKTLYKVINEKGIHLIDLAVDYSVNHEILNELLKNKTCLV